MRKPNAAVPILFALLAVMTARVAQGAIDLDEARRLAEMYQQQRIEVVNRLMPATIAIFPAGEGRGGGSGVIIDAEGYALTNFHVVQSAPANRPVSVGLADGRLVQADILGLDIGGDVALIKLRGDGPYPYAPMGNSEAVRMGDWTLAMGNPFNLAGNFKPTVTYGIVSGVERYQAGMGNNSLIYVGCIQVDTSINPGNSGGPLFNMRGEIIGINGRISIDQGRGRVNVGAGYAIPINQIRFFLDDLRAGKQVRHALLGVNEMEDIPEGIRLVELRPFGAAYRAGLQNGDVVTHFDGAPVQSIAWLRNRVGERPAGHMVTMNIMRDGQPQALDVRLGVRPLGVQQGARLATLPRYNPLPDEPVNPDAEPQEPRDVIARYVEAIGGDRYRSIVTIERTGEMAVLQGSNASRVPMKTLWRKPADMRQETTATAQGQTISQLTIANPDGAWQNVAGRSQRMADEQMDDFRRQMRLYAGLLDIKALEEGFTVEYAGVSRIHGREADVLRITDPDRYEDMLHFDRENGLLVKHEFVSAYTSRPMAMKNVEFEEIEFGGGTVTLPMHIEMYAGDTKTQDVTINAFELNGELPEGAFDPNSDYNKTQAPRPQRPAARPGGR